MENLSIHNFIADDLVL